jgi:hypothetical protein
MTLLVYVLVTSALLEIGMQVLVPLWRIRYILAPINVLVIAFSCGGLLAVEPNIFSLLLVLVGLYRIFNNLRIILHRMHEDYLRHATRRSTFILIAFQIVIAGFWLGWVALSWNGSSLWLILGILQVGWALVYLLSIARRMKRTRWPAKIVMAAENQLPTLSVAIPARNETQDLQECLQTLIACDYPKLEILVLDDCSQERRTPEIIRAYAHDGVRFVQGDEPRDTWLAKNQAYDKLVREASGQYILFCGVDLRFSKDSIRQVVSLMLKKNKQMISLLPWRGDSVAQHSALTQAMRYFWELAPPRRLFNRPPVLSSLWIIKKDVLKKEGGLSAVARSIVPEAYFAQRLLASDGYSFMRAGKSAGIESLKSAVDQRETAVRTRYPQLHRRPENVLLVSLAGLFFGLLPFVLAVFGYWLQIDLVVVVLSILASVLLIITFVILGTGTRTSSRLFSVIGMPAGTFYDLWLLHYSMFKYEFSVVEWKDRNICVPAMHVVPHLPEI